MPISDLCSCHRRRIPDHQHADMDEEMKKFKSTGKLSVISAMERAMSAQKVDSLPTTISQTKTIEIFISSTFFLSALYINK